MLKEIIVYVVWVSYLRDWHSCVPSADYVSGRYAIVKNFYY